jgi:hypothetical protein
MPELIPSTPAPGGEFLFYQTNDGRTRLQVRLDRETVWLSLNQMADLFQRDKSVISRHISNVFAEGELRREATVAESATVQTEGGKQVTREIEFIAKNYLSPEELNALNRIVVAYLELAEVQALNRKPMYMRDWIAKLDDFLRLGGRDILKHAGKVSHEQAVRKAEMEFEKFHRAQLAEPSQVEKHFDAALKELKKLPAPKGKKRRTTADDADNTDKK